jgi:hypothetical protein
VVAAVAVVATAYLPLEPLLGKMLMQKKHARLQEQQQQVENMRSSSSSSKRSPNMKEL